MLHQHLYLPGFAKQMIERFFKNGDLDKAKELAQDAAKRAESDRFSGLVKDFEEWLLKIAKQEKDIDTIRYYLKKFFFDRYHCNFDYYDRLKATYDSDSDWNKQISDFIKALKDKETDLLKVYIKEDHWDDFLQVIQSVCQDTQSSRSGDLAYYFHDVLSKRYPKELITLYANSVTRSLVTAKGRSHYQDICRTLRKMKKLGGKAEVSDIISFCREHYRNRPALQDELSRV